MSTRSLSALDARLAAHKSELQKLSLTEICDSSCMTSGALGGMISAAGLTLDISKHYCTAKTLRLFDELSNAVGLPHQIQRLFAGEPVNLTEHRSALHTSLRSNDPASPYAAEVAQVHSHMRSIVENLHGGIAKGFSGNPFTDVVNIGIGGSDLGPRFITSALKEFYNDALNVHFVANIDPAELDDTLGSLNP